jgi:hypothetical protein
MPFRITLLDNDQKILILSIMGSATLFDTQTGDFIRAFHITASNQIATFDKDSFLSIGGAPGGNYLHRYSLEGKKLESWWPTPKIDLSKPFTRNYATVVVEGTVFYAEGTYPEIQVIKGDQDRTWRLDPPKYYREPPAKPIAKSARFDQIKVQEYFESFTQLYSLKAMGTRFLAVCWSINQPHKGSLDIYGLEDRNLLIKDTFIPGLMVDASEKNVFALQEIESQTGEIVHKILVYTLVE